MRTPKCGDLKELTQVTQKNGRVSTQTQAEHALTKGLIDKYIMNIHTEASDIGLQDLSPNKAQHMASRQNWGHLLTQKYHDSTLAQKFK